MSFYLGQLIWLKLQRSCDLGARLTELKKKHISIELDLELAKKNPKTAQEEMAIMGGKHSTVLSAL